MGKRKKNVFPFLLPSFPPVNFFFLLVSRDTGDILLKICNLMPQDTGIYTCVAVNDHGSASSSASIKVQGNGTWIQLRFAIFKQERWSATRHVEQLSWFCEILVLKIVFGTPPPRRYPSSPGAARGAGSQQHGGDGPLASSGFVRSLCSQQLHCGVQAGRCVPPQDGGFTGSSSDWNQT